MNLKLSDLAKTKLFLHLTIVATMLVAMVSGILLPNGKNTSHVLASGPYYFYGNLLIDGINAPVGVVVTAKVNGVQCGSITTTE